MHHIARSSLLLDLHLSLLLLVHDLPCLLTPLRSTLMCSLILHACSSLLTNHPRSLLHAPPRLVILYAAPRLLLLHLPCSSSSTLHLSPPPRSLLYAKSSTPMPHLASCWPASSIRRIRSSTRSGLRWPRLRGPRRRRTWHSDRPSAVSYGKAGDAAAGDAAARFGRSRRGIEREQPAARRTSRGDDAACRFGRSRRGIEREQSVARIGHRSHNRRKHRHARCTILKFLYLFSTGKTCRKKRPVSWHSRGSF